MPALPLHEAGKYVAGAYLVFLALVLIYVAIMAIRLSHLDRDIAELAELAEERDRQREEAGAGTIPAGVTGLGDAAGMVE